MNKHCRHIQKTAYTIFARQDATLLPVDWNNVKAKLLNDSNAVQPLPASGDQLQLPNGVKFHKRWQIYSVIFPVHNVKLEFRVKDLGEEKAKESAILAEKQIRTDLSLVM